MNKKVLTTLACCLFSVATLFIASCGTMEFPFSGSTWTVAGNSLRSEDGRFDFQLLENGYQVDTGSVFITSKRDCAKYGNVGKYLRRICEEMPFVVDTILAYSPTLGVMYVVCHESSKPVRPVSITSSILSPTQYYTTWVRPDDIERWVRKDNEIYTNVVLNRKTRWLAIADRMTYRGKSVARIEILQSETPNTNSFGFPPMTFHWADVNSVNSLEIISDLIVRRRRMAIINYLGGQ